MYRADGGQDRAYNGPQEAQPDGHIYSNTETMRFAPKPINNLSKIWGRERFIFLRSLNFSLCFQSFDQELAGRQAGHNLPEARRALGQSSESRG